jgi:hypothetical protein
MISNKNQRTIGWNVRRAAAHHLKVDPVGAGNRLSGAFTVRLLLFIALGALDTRQPLRHILQNTNKPVLRTT